MIVNSKKLSLQLGASFLELIIVIALLGIMSTFIVPSIGSWTAKSRVEADYHSILSQIENLKTRVRLLNGTALLKCTNHSILSYQLSTNYQTSNTLVDSNFLMNIVKNIPNTNKYYMWTSEIVFRGLNIYRSYIIMVHNIICISFHSFNK